MASAREHRAPVDDADVVQSQEPPSKTFSPKRSLRFTHQEKLSVDLILDIDLKLREQPSVAGEVLIL
jgi:hypothetical protein